MRKGVALIVVGVAFVIVAVAGFVIVPQHAPKTTFSERARDGTPTCVPFGPTGFEGNQPYNCVKVVTRAGPSRSTYDALRITTWALMIVGALLIVMGLIGYARRP